MTRMNHLIVTRKPGPALVALLLVLTACQGTLTPGDGVEGRVDGAPGTTQDGAPFAHEAGASVADLGPMPGPDAASGLEVGGPPPPPPPGKQDAGVKLDVGSTSPPWFKGGVASCPELAAFKNKAADSSAALQTCINRTPQGAPLELAPGRYALAKQVTVAKAMTLRTAGQVGAAPCAAGASHACAELWALSSFASQFGLLRVSANGVTVDHLVLNGNRTGRGGGAAYAQCKAGNNSYGFNGRLSCSSCALTNSVSRHALCGTGLVVTGGSSITLTHNTFAYNGVHTTKNLWSDGLTVLEAKSSTFSSNTFIDNTDIDLIFGGCPSCKIQGNTIKHGASAAVGAFAALMIQKWSSTSGCYANVDVSNNAIDCGPQRRCGSGIYVGSESWYNQTPYGTLTPGTTSGSIHHNQIHNAQNGLYIAAIGLTIYKNGVLNAHGVPIPNSCHTSLVSATPYVVSPTAKSIHFMGENVDPTMKIHFSSASWAGCIPNWPF